GAALEFRAYRSERAQVAMAHRDHVVRADEQHQVAGLDDLAGLGQLRVLDVPRGAHYEERHRAVGLDLRPLAALDRVLDRELVELEDVLDVVGPRLVQTEPHERVVVLAGGGQRVAIGPLAGQPDAIDVHGTVDDAFAVGVARLAGRRGVTRHRREYPGHRADRGNNPPPDSADSALGLRHGARLLPVRPAVSVVSRKRGTG